MAKIEPEEAKRARPRASSWVKNAARPRNCKTVLNMHRMGSSLEFIASVTELPRARVERLIAEAA
jgi:hypothetical protein